MKVLVIYEHPKAKMDVIKWAEEHRIDIPTNSDKWEICTCSEYIKIIPSNFIVEESICDKLVLFGSFTKQNIIDINNNVIFSEE